MKREPEYQFQQVQRLCGRIQALYHRRSIGSILISDRESPSSASGAIAFDPAEDTW